MQDQFTRTAMQFGADGLVRLARSRVAVFGVGGVGGHCAEALIRAGIGAIDLIDSDIVDITNLNRQIVATHKTVGAPKADAMRDRLLDINPSAKITAHRMFYLPDTADSIDLTAYDYIADAIDTMTAKIELCVRASGAGVPVISSMGAANRLDPTAFTVTDIYETSVCPMARVMRRELRRRGSPPLRVVYSREPAITPLTGYVDESESVRRQIPSSNPFVPPVAGLIMAGEIIRALATSGDKLF